MTEPAARVAPLRIGNASGFYGDRYSAMREMLTGGDLDVLTGDYLAELTMLILARDRMKDPARGYARTFLGQLEECLGTAIESGVRIVANAGGLNPAGLATAIAALADKLGIRCQVGRVEGDDLLPRSAEFGFGKPLAANAYLGGWGIASCLEAGADVVVTGRVTDASLVVGPAAWHFGWQPDDFDQLAGAVVAGHVIECGTQATGGNYALFSELAAEAGSGGGNPYGRPLGFPIAEVAADGSSVITKHAGTGGAVTVGTVSAQLLYEVTGGRYAGPDVTARLDTARLASHGSDRVAITGVRGEPPPPELKVSLNELGGFRNQVEFVLTGLDIEAKAALVRSQLAGAAPAFADDAEWTLARTDHPDAAGEQEASALLRCVVRSADPDKIGRAFSNAAVELALASYPGFHLTTPPAKAAPYGVFRAAFVTQDAVRQVAIHPDGTEHEVARPATTRPLEALPEPDVPAWLPSSPVRTRQVPLGTVVGARSGDKGGSANIGVWSRTDAAWPWLVSYLDTAAVRRLLPELVDLPIERHVLPNLHAVNFVVDGILGLGVAYQARFDPQAKALGEWLRSRLVDVPEELL